MVPRISNASGFARAAQDILKHAQELQVGGKKLEQISGYAFPVENFLKEMGFDLQDPPQPDPEDPNILTIETPVLTVDDQKYKVFSAHDMQNDTRGFQLIYLPPQSTDRRLSITTTVNLKHLFNVSSIHTETVKPSKDAQSEQEAIRMMASRMTGHPGLYARACTAWKKTFPLQQALPSLTHQPRALTPTQPRTSGGGQLSRVLDPRKIHTPITIR